MKCKVCGREFELNAERHYIARSDTPPGIFQGELTLYDAFDCPHCGCQHIANKRKRTHFPPLNKESTEDEEKT